LYLLLLFWNQIFTCNTHNTWFHKLAVANSFFQTLTAHLHVCISVQECDKSGSTGNSDEWIQKRGPVEWPPQSPNFIPLGICIAEGTGVSWHQAKNCRLSRCCPSQFVERQGQYHVNNEYNYSFLGSSISIVSEEQQT
jgi:hypothetical protein